MQTSLSGFNCSGCGKIETGLVSPSWRRLPGGWFSGCVEGADGELDELFVCGATCADLVEGGARNEQFGELTFKDWARLENGAGV